MHDVAESTYDLSGSVMVTLHATGKPLRLVKFKIEI
jgi:hypothetical protein